MICALFVFVGFGNPVVGHGRAVGLQRELPVTCAAGLRPSLILRGSFASQLRHWARFSNLLSDGPTIEHDVEFSFVRLKDAGGHFSEPRWKTASNEASRERSDAAKMERTLMWIPKRKQYIRRSTKVDLRNAPHSRMTRNEGREEKSRARFLDD